MKIGFVGVLVRGSFFLSRFTALRLSIGGLFFSFGATGLTVYVSYMTHHFYVVTGLIGLIFLSLSFVVSPLYRYTLDCSTEPMGFRIAFNSFFISGLISLSSLLVTFLPNKFFVSIGLLMWVELLLGALLFSAHLVFSSSVYSSFRRMSQV